MKTIVLMINRVRQFAVRNKLIFILFIIGSILNSIVFTFLYGNLMPAMRNYTSTLYYYRTYVVAFSWTDIGENGFIVISPQKNFIFEDDINTLIDTDLFESIIVESIYTQDLYADSSSIPESICTCIYGIPNHLAVNNGSGEFTGFYQAVMPDMSHSRVGGSVVIREREFEVIGRSGDLIPPAYLIPPESYRELDPDSNYMVLISKARWHLNNDVPFETLTSMFPDARIRSGLSVEKTDMQMIYSILPWLIVCFSITLISFAFLLDYLASMLSEENAISLLVGGRPADICAMSMLEGIILSVITIIIGLLLHKELYDPVFSKLNTTSLEYRFSDYLFMFFIMTMISVLIMVVRSGKYLKMSPQRLRNSE